MLAINQLNISSNASFRATFLLILIKSFFPSFKKTTKMLKKTEIISENTIY